MTDTATSQYHWLKTGDLVLAGMLQAIEQATVSIRLEMYIYADSPVGEKFRSALIAARLRGVKVQLMIDALGSITLADSYWDEFRKAGGEFHWFNPIHLRRTTFRDHRKILVCDEQLVFIGGVNIAPEYDGDGVDHGWRDLGLRIDGPLAKEFAAAFDEMFAHADMKLKMFQRWRRLARRSTVALPEGKLLLSGPGRDNPLKRTLFHDLKGAKSIRIVCAYFLPPRRMRTAIMRAARRGGRVQIILPGKSDVAMSQAAARSLYRRFMRAGVEIYEYQPQILHAKLFLIDDIVHVGSANLDLRSLNINYELLLRLQNPALLEGGQSIFDDCLKHCRKINPVTWKKERTFWEKVKARFAYFILARVDLLIARIQWEIMR